MRDIDLNLLTVFDAVMSERNLRKAGERLGRSQPAISQSVARLRDITQDQLFKKSPAGVVPTARAETLWIEIRDPLAQLRAAFLHEKFEPRNMVGELVFGLSDDVRILFWPQIARLVMRDAPKITMRVLDTNHLTVWDDLRIGRLDIALTVAGQPPPGLGARILHQDEFRLLHTKGQQPPKTAKDYARLKHIAVAFGDEQPAYADEALGASGMARKIVAKVSRFDTLPGLVKELNAVVALPSVIARHFAKVEGLACSKLPLPFPPAILKLCWNEKSRNDPRTSWLRALGYDCISSQISQQ